MLQHRLLGIGLVDEPHGAVPGISGGGVGDPPKGVQLRYQSWVRRGKGRRHKPLRWRKCLQAAEAAAQIADSQQLCPVRRPQEILFLKEAGNSGLRSLYKRQPQHAALPGDGLHPIHQMIMIVRRPEQRAVQRGRCDGGPGGTGRIRRRARGCRRRLCVAVQPRVNVPAHLIEVPHHHPVRLYPLGQMILFCVVHITFSFLFLWHGKKPLHTGV